MAVARLLEEFPGLIDVFFLRRANEADYRATWRLAAQVQWIGGSRCLCRAPLLSATAPKKLAAWRPYLAKGTTRRSQRLQQELLPLQSRAFSTRISILTAFTSHHLQLNFLTRALSRCRRRRGCPEMLVMLPQQKLIGHPRDVVAHNLMARLRPRQLLVRAGMEPDVFQVIIEQLRQHAPTGRDLR